MKKIVQITLVSLFSLVFYFLLSSNSKATATTFIYSNEQNAPEKVSSVDASDFYFSTRTTNTFAIAKNNVSSSFKTFSNAVFAAHSKAIESIFQVAYWQFTLHSKNSLFRLEQSKILFPFHYHW
ncbi:hypothetical protein [Flavobacterium aquatile]|uniref:Uncharacterized protein n=1 Tax=Flavobacterium aquatile LMG 4008 = ATCC 11947 TaxID=1453498 RepID=A0A095U1V8_9FLAO|nr:hypothetical protein [Flavobacterium aquatile]KGD68558.1 hypothetical protein LG45_09810 [Flavobacterium aquatile LMG 4008 = ATCC 11947]OXA68513.1 hypothetical protein B0A61_02035 [Flavobacterium aquatile LMG 4008 = ATCC 11947]